MEAGGKNNRGLGGLTLEGVCFLSTRLTKDVKSDMFCEGHHSQANECEEWRHPYSGVSLFF